MRRIPVSHFIPVMSLLTLLATGCPGGGRKPQFPPHLLVNFTGQIYGTMFPCGCHVPTGGLARLGGVVNQSEGESPYPQITLDAGSFSSGNTGYELFNAQWILKAFSTVGYQAVNIGWYESLMPVSRIRELDAASGNMLVSANLIDADNLPVTRKYLVREVGGIKIGITGIVRTRQNSPSAGLDRGETEMPQFLMASEALKDVMDEFKRERVDYVILLADTDNNVIDAVLQEIPGINLVIQGQTVFNKSSVVGPRIVNDFTRVVQIGGQGKLVGRLRLDFEPDGTITDEEPILVELDPSAPVMGAVTELMYQYKIELRANRDQFLSYPANPFMKYVSPGLTDVFSGYVGQSVCASCHQTYAIDVQSSGHRDAWNMLPEANLLDPNCLPCHTTGYGVPTGLVDPYRDSQLAGVTCEACHGPGAGHAREMYAAQGDFDASSALPEENPTGLEFRKEVPREVCMQCHTQEWSPDFDYDKLIIYVNHALARDMPSGPQDGTQDNSALTPEDQH